MSQLYVIHPFELLFVVFYGLAVPPRNFAYTKKVVDFGASVVGRGFTDTKDLFEHTSLEKTRWGAGADERDVIDKQCSQVAVMPASSHTSYILHPTRFSPTESYHKVSRSNRLLALAPINSPFPLRPPVSQTNSSSPTEQTARN